MARLPPETEQGFLRAVVALARLRGWRVFHQRPARTAHGWRSAVQGDGRGFPDLILLRGNVIHAWELKTGRGKPTAEQEDWLQAFRDAGVDAKIVRPQDWPAIEAALSRKEGA